ncbi:GmrSD restriction endonuclease domain-containing protein [Haladaptatus salinisoli]|uniref:GmrSD restriction endonuclease domain-containing protein n=1 Tax=Haladaptatus salinisoli TaxID=2884876 RepID=UPI001D0B4BEE|nr:DUF262 domain-containing protein [Haladaptatus salinisoli]
MKIEKLLDRVESNAIVLPEFQREFVWKRQQAKALMDSLYKGYPIGGLLTWETENPPEIKNDAIDEEKQALFEILLDGQQRLTVLYMLLMDEIPPYYDESDIENDPRKLYFNVETAEFHFENKRVREGTVWVKVTDCFTDEISAISIARSVVGDDDPEEVLQISEQYEKQLKQLQNVGTNDIPVETLPKSADIHQAIELFDKINSQGTHLSDAELALAHMSAEWPHIRRHMKEKQAKLAERGFDFDLNFYVKCMIGTITQTMTYEQVYDTPREILEAKWRSLAKDDGVLDYLVNVLRNEAHIPNSDYINTRDVLIPFIVYLDKTNRQITQQEKKEFIRWLYAAMMWTRYSGSSDSTVEHDLSLLDNPSPTKDLMQEIKNDRGRIEVQASDLRGRGKRTRRFYNMVRMVTRANKPVDWKTGEPLVGSFRLESHHIFPKSRLYEEYDAGQSEHRKLVNEIANRAFLTPETNKKLGDTLPEAYLPEVKESHPDALKSQFIPDNPELWKVENYEDFLAKRREKLATAINDYMESLITDGGGKKRESIEDLLAQGENARVEFKETFLYDVYRDQPNKELKAEVVKEIASFANSDGGVVIIGVEDETHEPVGIDRDLKLMKKGKDSFELQLNREISNRLGKMMAAAYTHLSFEEVDGKTVCVVWVDDSPDPVYFEDGDEEKFYARAGSSSEPLGIQDANRYIQRNWN